MTAGRPTEYRPEMCVKAVDLMRDGASKTEVAAELGVCKQTLYEWIKKHPEFDDAIKKGTDLCESWWERQGRIALREEKFSATLWYMNMKNRFRWADKQESTVEMSGNLSFADGVSKARERAGKAKEEK